MRFPLKVALVATALLLVGPARAQEPDAPALPSADGAPDVPAKPKARPKPKPKPRPVPKSEADSERKSPGGGTEPAPDLRRTTDDLRNPPESPPPSQSAFAAPPVACDPGQAVLYDGPKTFSLWVTRAGSVTIDNPLRPLTPDVTRVLQLVIGDRLATAYGRDLTSLRRGAAPGALESLLGGPIHWDATLGSLPDSFDIVSDAGAPLAQMRFKACGTAPAAKAPPAPVARKDGRSRPSKRAPAVDQAASPPPASLGRPAGTAPGPAAQPRQFNLPQGAISE